MTTLFQITPKQQAWIDRQSPAVQSLIEKRPYNLLYRYKPLGARAILISYADGTAVNLAITADNAIIFGHLIPNVRPDDIEECDLDSDQFLGASLTEPAKVFVAFGDVARAMSA